jgi:hypothetical protein
VEPRFRSSFQLLVSLINGMLLRNMLITYVELIVIGLVVCMVVCVCVCVCLCVCAVSCGMAWFLSLVEVVFCIGVLGYVHSQCLGGGGSFMAGGSLKECQRLRWGIWYGRLLSDCWL